MISLLLFLILVQEPRIITCTITEVNRTVSCEGRRRTVPRVDWVEWKWEAPLRSGWVNPDADLTRRRLAVGDKVKAQFVKGELIPVADCQVRVWRNKRTWLAGRRGERMPSGLDTEPDDCQPWYDKQELKRPDDQ